MSRRTAAALGIALAFLIVAHLYWNSDDMAAFLCPAARVAEPYTQGAGFFYPVWTLYLLKGFCYLPRTGVMAGIWSILVVLICSRYWRTPAWVILIAPPFLWGVGFCHPFEALAFLGLTLIAQGHMSSGLLLLAFKPQLGLIPGLYAVWQYRRKWQSIVMPLLLMAVTTTCVDFALTGRLWIIPFYHMVQSTMDLPWNASLWTSLGWLSLLWLPIGAWALYSQQDERRRLFVAYALGLLVAPYWAAYSLWPLVAMIGCFYAVERES